MKKIALLLFVALASASAFAKKEFIFDDASNRVIRSGWVNLDKAHHICGSEWTPDTISNRTVIIHRWCMNCPGIENAIKGFIKFEKRHPEVVCLVSYYPGQPHTRDAVLNYVKALKLKKFPVYTGAAHIAAQYGTQHRALYIVSPSGRIVWESSDNRKDQLDELDKAFKKERENLLLEEIERTKDASRKSQLKSQFKKFYPKSAAKLENL